MARFSYRKDGNLAVSFKNYFKAVKAKAVEREDALLIEFNKVVLSLTPVWEGELIRNWRWSTKQPVMELVQPIESPGDPGHTGKSLENPEGMALGEEPRRAANQIRPQQSLLAALRAHEPVDIFLTNASPIAVDAEYGLVPTPERSRSAAGIVRLAMRKVFGDAV